MGLTFEHIENEHYALLHFYGELNYEALLGILPEILAVVEKHPRKAALLNFTTLEEAHLSNFDRYNIAIKASEIFPLEVKLAVFEKKEYINKFAETVARNRMLQLLVSHDKEEIKQWLMD